MTFRPNDRPPMSRSHFGACLHVPPGETDPYAYIVQGWNAISPNGRQYYDALRTKDFLKVERAYRPGLPHWGWGDVQSFQGKLIRGPGYDGSTPHLVANGDQVIGTLFASDDGNDFVALPPTPALAAEVGLFRVNGAGTKLLFGMGVRYEQPSTPGAPWSSGPSYVLRNPRGVYALLSDLQTYETRTADCGFRRRSFAQEVMPNGLLVIHGGYDDELNGGTIINDMRVSADDGATWSNLGPMPFGTVMGHDFVTFLGRLWSFGGRYSANSYSASVWSTPNLTSPGTTGDWYRHADTPFPAAVGSKPIVLTVDGVETLFILGGSQAGGPNPPVPRHGLWKSTDGETWAEMRGSDFWPD